MAEFLNKQDAGAGLEPTRIGRHRIAKYDPLVLLKVLERIAGGDLLIDLEKEPGYPRRLTIMQWIMADGAAARAFQAAVEMSAMAMEEKAIQMGKEIAGAPGSGTRVRAFEVAMNQLRWSASRRNPKKFGEQRSTTVVVPVTINTSLPLGGASVGTGTEDHPNIYQIEAKVVVEDEETAIVEAAETNPDEPFIDYDPEPDHGPRKVVLVPGETGVPDPEREAQAERRLQAKLKKNKEDRERLAKVKDQVRATGKLPGDMTYREMKTWLETHPPLDPKSTPSGS